MRDQFSERDGLAWRHIYQSSPARFALPRLDETSPYYSDDLAWLFGQAETVSGTVSLRIPLPAWATGIPARLRLSNEEGIAPLLVTGGSVTGGGSSAVLKFGGETQIRIPTGAPAVSDAFPLPGEGAMEIALEVVDLALPAPGIERGSCGMVLSHAGTMRDIRGRPIVSGIEVRAEPVATVVALGDSFIDVNGAVDPTWTEKLRTRTTASRASVINAGIAGNRVISDGWGRSMLARLDRDALRISGASHVILSGGINDIGMAGPSPVFAAEPAISTADLIAGYTQIEARVRSSERTLVLSTLPPFAGSFFFSAEREEQRQTVNAWIRSSGISVLDLDAVLRDPSEPIGLNAQFDSGDRLHPNAAGHEAIAASLETSMLT